MTTRIVNRVKTSLGKLKSRITPAFLVALVMALIFWYSGKLQYTYTATIPVSVVIEGERHRVTCVVEGTGHNIITARYLKRKTLKLHRFEVELMPVDNLSNTYEVSPESLQNIISVRNPSLKIISVSRMPFIILED